MNPETTVTAVDAAPAARKPGDTAWYREPWPWLLSIAPVSAIVAGTITIGIAFGSFDGVVADDYYRQGLAINRMIEREASARARGIDAQVLFNPSGERVRVTVSGDMEATQSLQLTLVRSARAGNDQRLRLEPIGPGLFEARLERPISGRWQLQLEDSERSWRVSGQTMLPAEGSIRLAATEAGATIR
jgi:uncharacterized protein